MKVSILDVVELPKFQGYIKTERFWRTHGKLKVIFGDILKDLTGVDHTIAKECDCDHMAKNTTVKLKKKRYIKLSFNSFKEAEADWMASTRFKMCCGLVEQEQNPDVEEQEVEEQEVGEQRVNVQGVEEHEVEEHEVEQEVEQEIQVVQPSPSKAVQVEPGELEPRHGESPAKRRRTTYSAAARSTRYRMLEEEMRRIKQDLQFEEDLREKLDKRGRKRSREEQEERPTGSFFDVFLSCFNAIDGMNISLNKWDFFRMWICDFIERGGDVTKLPCAKTLRIYREKMVAPGLLVSTTVARIPLQNVFKHTVERLAKRPDVVDYLDLLQDGAVLDVLWKWGMDGQNGEFYFCFNSTCFVDIFLSPGLPAFSRTKSHDDRQVINEGVSLIQVRIKLFHALLMLILLPLTPCQPPGQD